MIAQQHAKLVIHQAVQGQREQASVHRRIAVSHLAAGGNGDLVAGRAGLRINAHRFGQRYLRFGRAVQRVELRLAKRAILSLCIAAQHPKARQAIMRVGRTEWDVHSGLVAARRQQVGEGLVPLACANHVFHGLSAARQPIAAASQVQAPDPG